MTVPAAPVIIFAAMGARPACQAAARAWRRHRPRPVRVHPHVPARGRALARRERAALARLDGQFTAPATAEGRRTP